MKTIFYRKDTGAIHSTTDGRAKLDAHSMKLGLGVVYVNEYDRRWETIEVANGVITGANGVMFGEQRTNRKFTVPYRLTEVVETTSQLPTGNQVRIAFARFIGIGDILMSLQVALPSLRRSYPDAHITYITSPVGARLLAASSYVDSVVKIDYKHNSSPVVQLPENLEVSQYNVLINMINRVDFLPIVLKKNRPDNMLSVMNEQLRTQGRKACKKQMSIPSIYIGTSSLNWLHRVFQINRLKQPIIGCQLMSHGVMKHLGVDQWKRLATLCPEYTFLWFGDQGMYADIKDLPENVLNTVSTLNFDEFLTLWSACDATISIDSGGAHLSGCFSQPCVVLIGSTKYKDHFLNYESTVELQAEQKLSCQPCIDWQLRSDCKGESVAWCLGNIKPEMIKHKLMRVLHGNH